MSTIIGITKTDKVKSQIRLLPKYKILKLKYILAVKNEIRDIYTALPKENNKQNENSSTFTYHTTRPFQRN